MDKNIDIEKEVESEIERISSELSEKDLKFYTNLATELKNKSEPFEDKELYNIFDKLDEDEKGTIEFDKLYNFLLVFRSDINKFYMDYVIHEFIKEKTEYLTRDEFVDKMKYGKEKKKSSKTEVEEIFDLLDTDHDKMIGVEDIRTAMTYLGEDMFDSTESENLIRLIMDKKPLSREDDLYKDKQKEVYITKEKFMELFQYLP